MIHFLTVVWGGYVQLYLDVVIPAQLTAGNLPAAGNCRYIIFTTREDRRTIEAAPIFRKLRKTVPVTFEFADDNRSKYRRVSMCLRRGIGAANREGAACVFLCPDIVFADGAFAAVVRLAQDHDVVYLPVIRTLKEAAASIVHPVTPRALMRFALANLHPLAYCSFWQEGGADLIPANLYWRVGDQGILARCYHLHPLYVRPQVNVWQFNGTIDNAYCDVACPDASRDYVITDSDELCAVELSDQSHYFTHNVRKGDVQAIALWAQKHATPRHRLLFERTIRLHTGITNEAAWQQIILRADAIACEIKDHPSARG